MSEPSIIGSKQRALSPTSSYISNAPHSSLFSYYLLYTAQYLSQRSPTFCTTIQFTNTPSLHVRERSLTIFPLQHIPIFLTIVPTLSTYPSVLLNLRVHDPTHLYPSRPAQCTLEPSILLPIATHRKHRALIAPLFHVALSSLQSRSSYVIQPHVYSTTVRCQSCVLSSFSM